MPVELIRIGEQIGVLIGVLLGVRRVYGKISKVVIRYRLLVQMVSYFCWREKCVKQEGLCLRNELKDYAD